MITKSLIIFLFQFILSKKMLDVGIEVPFGNRNLPFLIEKQSQTFLFLRIENLLNIKTENW